MWTGEVTMADAVLISALGLLVVFAALASLAIAIIIISKILGVLIKTDTPKAAAAAAVVAPVPAIDEESYAVLLAAISEEARLSGEEIRVKSIKEL